MESILTSIKKSLGIGAEYTHFDDILVFHINSVFSILTQLGVGPSKGFSISDSSAAWDDYIPNGETLQFVKTYMSLKVKLIFDPPLWLLFWKRRKRRYLSWSGGFRSQLKQRIQAVATPIPTPENTRSFPKRFPRRHWRLPTRYSMRMLL